MTSNSEIKLGVWAQDIVTGFQGTITARIDYLTECTQYCISPKATEDGGKLPENRFFDESRIMVIGAGVSEQFIPRADPPEANLPPKGFDNTPQILEQMY